jgi:transposase
MTNNGGDSMAHDIQIRTRAVELLDEGYTQENVAKLLNVGTTSIKRWKAQIKEHGKIQYFYDATNRTCPKLPKDKLLEHYKNDSDALLKETAKIFGCHPSAVFYACKRFKITNKKRQFSIRNAMNKSEKTSEKE